MGGPVTTLMDNDTMAFINVNIREFVYRNFSFIEMSNWQNMHSFLVGILQYVFDDWTLSGKYMYCRYTFGSVRMFVVDVP